MMGDRPEPSETAEGTRRTFDARNESKARGICKTNGVGHCMEMEHRLPVDMVAKIAVWVSQKHKVR